MEDKFGRPKFFHKIFLVADTNFEVILGMLFLKLSNVDVLLGKGTLTWWFYITNKALSTNKQVQLINLKEFVITALDTDNKTFVVYVPI